MFEISILALACVAYISSLACMAYISSLACVAYISSLACVAYISSLACVAYIFISTLAWQCMCAWPIFSLALLHVWPKFPLALLQKEPFYQTLFIITSKYILKNDPINTKSYLFIPACGLRCLWWTILCLVPRKLVLQRKPPSSPPVTTPFCNFRIP